MELRPYQQAAVDAVWNHLRTHTDNPCVVIPTAGGKTPLLATLVKDALTRWNGRVMILSHVKELLSQAVDKIRAIYPECDLGVYSAGLGSRETGHACIVAGIQSVYRHAKEIGNVDLIICDECHSIPLAGMGIYRTFLQGMKEITPHLRVIGLTATPYRLDGGPICGPDNIINSICYEAGIKELLGQGYLCSLKSKASKHSADTSSISIRNGEFANDEVNAVMDSDDLVTSSCREIAALTRDRKSILIFCSSVAHAKHVAEQITNFTGQECGVVTGDTPSDERAEILARFKGEKVPSDLFGGVKPPLKYLSNCSILTTGFDAPNIDCVVLLRPTVSPGLYYQMVGRGFRLHPDKKDTLVLDFAGNIVRHGPVDCIRPEANAGTGNNGKVCPNCDEAVSKSVMVCPQCGYIWVKQEGKPRELKHDVKPSDASIISGETEQSEYKVAEVRYCVHTRKDAGEDAPKTMRIDYIINMLTRFSEWICPEHANPFVRDKFLRWWREHAIGVEIPATAAEAVWRAEEGCIRCPEYITVRKTPGRKFPEIVGYKYPVIPDDIGDDDLPF